jgi:hypothetical protein
LLAWLLLKVLIKLEYMLAGPLVFALAGCMGLFAALQIETYARYFLADYQCRALSGKCNALPLTGWKKICLHYCHHSYPLREQAQLLGLGV